MIPAVLLLEEIITYCQALDIWHPTFWLSKGHFHGTYVPFYNFPYTFGFLFANGIYAKARENQESFEESYIELLRHTGSMTTETLAERFLAADLAQSHFWQSAIAAATAEIGEFLELSERYIKR